MPRTVNVNYVTKEVKILLHDSETESLAAATAIAAAESAQEAKDVVVDNLQDSLGAIDAKTETGKAELDNYTEIQKAEISTLGQGYVDEANTILTAIRNEYGYPFTVSAAADMTDATRIYVYTGSETGYTNGNWYYYDGSAWVSGGVYNAVAFDTDKTLSVGGEAADAKVTGNKITDIVGTVANNPLTTFITYENWTLTGTGLSRSYQTNTIAVYAVTAGEKLYLRLAKDWPYASNAEGVYQWQKNATNIPTSGTNQNLIGTPVTIAVDGFVTVPEGAEYLIVSQKTANVTNIVADCVDTTLTVSGVAADAKVTGDRITAAENQTANIAGWADYYIKTTTGTEANINDAISGVPFEMINLSVAAIQNGSGDPSFNNVRNIDGTTEAVVNHSGSSRTNPTTYSLDWSQTAGELYVGDVTYDGNINWNIKPRCVLAEVTYNFFANATSITVTDDYVFIRNAFYSDGNGVTYRNRNRIPGGYYCKSNVFQVEALNDTRFNNSQQRLYLKNTAGWTTVEGFLSDVSDFISGGGTIQFVYEPTDEIPIYTEATDSIVVIAGENNLWSTSGSVTASYRASVLEALPGEPAPQTDVLTANEDAINKIYASRWLRSETAKPLSLLWFSDIHRWSMPLGRAVKFKKYLENLSLIEDTIVTGDLVRNASSEGSVFTDFWNVSGTENILIALGNHDHYAQSAQPHGKATFADLNTLFFGNVNLWGVVRESNYPFYYKDYAEQKIRLIVADAAVTSDQADETTWLNNALADAKELGYAVVVASHYLRLTSDTETTSVTILDNAWSNNVARTTGTDVMSYDWQGCDIVKCVSDFIADGGKFLCYMIGHTHTDIISHPTGHPEQLIINVACASPDRSHETKITTNDLPRYENSRTQDCFNVITFDAENSIIKCVRVGSNINMYQIPRTAFGYDVTNHEFISLV